MERVLVKHVRDNLGLYLLVGFFFLAGIAGGAFMVWLLKPNQQAALAGCLNTTLEQFSTVQPDMNLTLNQALLAGLKEIGLLWFLGLTVIGIPLIAGFVFFKGFALGFTVGFLVQEKAWQGLALSFFSVLPPNIITIPTLFLAGVSGISFSLELIRGRQFAEISIWRRFTVFTLLMGLLWLGLVAGGLVEAFLSPAMVKIVLSYL